MKLLWAYTSSLAACILTTTASPVDATSTAAAAAAIASDEAALPLCALECVAQYVPQYCDSEYNTTCVCETPMLSLDLAECLGANCTVKESLLAERFQKADCGAPIRDESATTRKASWPFFALAAASVLFRFVARSKWMDGAGLGWDDWTILLCLCLLAAGNSLLDLMTRNGLGQDIWMLDPAEITYVLYLFWVQEFIYLTIINATKISILLLYLRIFPSTVSTWFRRTCFGMIGICIAYFIGSNLSTLFECKPINLAWLQWDGEHKGHCFDQEAQIFANAGINIVLDLVVFFLPIPKLMKLEITPKKKIGICLTFIVGLFVTICSVIRLQYLVRWGATTNPMWDYNAIAIWSSIEGNCTVICACMPSMAGPIKKLYMTTIGSRISFSGSRNKNGSHGRAASGDVQLSNRYNGPEDRISKTTAVTAEYDARTTSSGNDEVELVDKSQYHAVGDKSAHSYVKEWQPV
ncbi:hypothetical protein LTR85_008457 [Meristemomyces frigidus]|nr:hypothetical protein LTR85_008457 [Meristemomyces frigidus]